MSAGFTPGPWEPVFGKAHPSVQGLRWVEVTPPRDFPIHRDYSTEANAHLIAAAPELFKALEGAIEPLETAVAAKQALWDAKHGQASNDWRVIVLREIEEAKAALTEAQDALAKARGEQA